MTTDKNYLTYLKRHRENIENLDQFFRYFAKYFGNKHIHENMDEIHQFLIDLELEYYDESS